MQTVQPALPMRDHTILGVCEGLGEDFGFNPLYLRVVFAALVIWQPVYDVGAYLALGLVVLAARLLVPRRPATETKVTALAAAGAAQQEREEFAVAA